MTRWNAWDWIIAGLLAGLACGAAVALVRVVWIAVAVE